MFYFLDAPATLMLLITATMISGYAMFSKPGLVNLLAFRPGRIREQGELYRMATAWMVHGGVAHLIFNMYTLYAFGRGLEALIGTGAFLLVFFGSELCANGLSFVLKRNDATYSAVGASGAISGILFSYSLYRPLAYIYLFGVIPMPSWVFAILFVVVSVTAMGRKKGGGGIAHEAHLGGALGGVLITLLLDPRALGIFLGQLGF
jgi:membrane associated rhomboid family serine protease